MHLLNCMNLLLLDGVGVVGGVVGGVVRVGWVVGSRSGVGTMVERSISGVRVSSRGDADGRQQGSGPLLDEVSRGGVGQMRGDVRRAVQKGRRVGRVGGGDQRR